MIQLSVQLFFFFNVKSQSFYEPIDIASIKWGTWEPIISYEDTVIFLVANFQIVVSCIAFSKSKPFRKPIWTNPLFFVSIILILAFDLWLLFSPANNPLKEWLDLKPFTDQNGTQNDTYRYWIGLAVLINSAATLLVEFVIVEVVGPRHEARVRVSQKALLQRRMELLS